VDLLTLLIAIAVIVGAFVLVEWFVKPPYLWYARAALIVFVVIFACERFGVFAMLQRIRI
jgi:uncharacterized membrane protein YqjE